MITATPSGFLAAWDGAIRKREAKIANIWALISSTAHSNGKSLAECCECVFHTVTLAEVIKNGMSSLKYTVIEGSYHPDAIVTF